MPLTLADNAKSEDAMKNKRPLVSVGAYFKAYRKNLLRSNYFQKGVAAFWIGGRMLKMKVTKKKVLVVALAAGLIATISVGSLAWFSDEDEVTNKFMIADSDDDTPDDIFSIDVQEDTPEDNGDDDGFTYEDVQPGDELKKEPYAINTGYYDQYVRAVVTVSDAAAWKAVLGDTTEGVIPADTIFSGIDTTNWLEWTAQEKYDTATDTMTYVFYYEKILEGKDKKADEADRTTEKIFEKVKIPQNMTKEQAVAFNHEFDITVKAQAVQTENVGANALEAFNTVGMPIA